MKKIAFQGSRALLLAVALSLAPVHWGFAQDQEKEVVVPLRDTAAVQKTATGNITEVNQDSLFIKGAGDDHPTGYITTKATYVDDGGAPSQRANAKVGHAVIITYVVEGNTRVALKVVIRNAP